MGYLSDRWKSRRRWEQLASKSAVFVFQITSDTGIFTAPFNHLMEFADSGGTMWYPQIIQIRPWLTSETHGTMGIPHFLETSAGKLTVRYWRWPSRNSGFTKKNGGSFHSYVNVYQSVSIICKHLHYFLALACCTWWNQASRHYGFPKCHGPWLGWDWCTYPIG